VNKIQFEHFLFFVLFSLCFYMIVASAGRITRSCMKEYPGKLQHVCIRLLHVACIVHGEDWK